ncbi:MULTISPECIES: gamma-glutamylcyclotransferase [unclassified Microbacterium]|uniref:gamma-glutamylcyclotransferase n=1 Tax=unclassified Microbacterium TaxID=2609290 RepID=UPI00214C284B|nr:MULTISPECIES: gamma-glutamylcyclotransferase [unclassified Microbacterium]MCR2784219.1 gamma-glutamylcyclotransferase [Microbacterium sp. zg.B96]MDL5350870.1 gamma-glutamylcyclotransferase [Microbacterium sp. zg-YB36]WIM14950.1 gamma-glutamylcyclotransferase [Microbacterium sp. zg-B96]
MGETGELLFSYGSLGGGEIQLDTFGRVVHTEQDVLPGYVAEPRARADPLLAERIGPIAQRVLRETRDPRDKVIGRLLVLTAAELDAADELVTPLLRRMPVTLASGRVAWVYVAAGS